MDIKKNNIAALNVDTNKHKVYNDNKETIDIEPPRRRNVVYNTMCNVSST